MLVFIWIKKEIAKLKRFFPPLTLDDRDMHVLSSLLGEQRRARQLDNAQRDSPSRSPERGSAGRNGIHNMVSSHLSEQAVETNCWNTHSMQ